MPTISKTQYPFENAQFARVINCDSRGTFTCNLPEPVMKMLGIHGVSGATLRECEKHFTEAIEQYKSLRTSKCKVILYKIKSSAYIYRNDACVLHTQEISFSSGLSLAVAAGVFDEIKITQANGQIRFNYEALDSSLPHSVSSDCRHELKPYRNELAENRLEWTPEREAFFCKLSLAIENIILELTKLDSPQAIENIISSNLLTFKPDERSLIPAHEKDQH